MPTRLLPLEPIVTVPVIVENEETPLQLCALEVARCEFGLMTNIQAVCDQPVHAQIIRFGLPTDREAFQYRLLLGLREQAQPLKPSEADIDRALLQLQTQVEQALRQQAAQPTEAADERTRVSVTADQLVQLACDSAQLFLTPHAEPFAHVQIETEGEKGRKGEGEPSEQSKIENRKSKIAQTLPLRSPEFRDWLAQRCWRRQHQAPKPYVLNVALDLLAGLARYEGGPPRPLYHRTAWHESALWLDRGDAAWQAIRITSEGWQILPDTRHPTPDPRHPVFPDPPPLFRRSPATAALPMPEPGGSLAELRACLNLPDNSAWSLLLGWLVAAFFPLIPHPHPF